MPKKIFAIIVTWNGMKWISRSLNSLKESTYSVSVVVIDNGSSDETVGFIKEKYPSVHLVESGENLGFGQANNVGMRYALSQGCDYVYLLNQDAYIYPDMFEKLLTQAEKPENKDVYAIYSPLHVNGDVHKLDKQFKGYIKEIGPTIIEDMFLDRVKDVYPVDGVPAAGWLLPKSTLENIGGFDPIFFHYGEDHHYFQRVLYHGYKTGLVPGAKMIHDREDFGNQEVASKNHPFRTIKSQIFLNITLSKKEIIRKMMKVTLSFSYESLRCLVHFNLNMFFEYQKAIWGNLLRFRAYQRNREINKKRHPNWL